VWPDAVVDVAEAGGLHRERAAVVDRGAVEVLVLQRAEESLDDAVGLRAPDAGADVAQQRLIAGEGRLVGLAAKARALSETTAIGARTTSMTSPVFSSTSSSSPRSSLKGSPHDKVDCRCGYAAAGSTV